MANTTKNGVPDFESTLAGALRETLPAALGDLPLETSLKLLGIATDPVIHPAIASEVVRAAYDALTSADSAEVDPFQLAEAIGVLNRAVDGVADVAQATLVKALQRYETLDTGLDEHVALLDHVVGLGSSHVVPACVSSYFDTARAERHPPARLAATLLRVYARTGAERRDGSAVCAAVASLAAVPRLPRLVDFDAAEQLLTSLLTLYEGQDVQDEAEGDALGSVLT